MRRVHELKVWPGQFQAIRDGAKRFEWRKNDRGFKVGDTLRLREWDPNTGDYTGRSEPRAVTYMLEGGKFGVPDGYCVLSLA